MVDQRTVAAIIGWPEETVLRLDVWQLACVLDGLQAIDAKGVLEQVEKQVERQENAARRGPNVCRVLTVDNDGSTVAVENPNPEGVKP